METGAGVTEAVLAGTELSEVLSSLGDDIVEELEGDSAGRLAYYTCVRETGDWRRQYPLLMAMSK